MDEAGEELCERLRGGDGLAVGAVDVEPGEDRLVEEFAGSSAGRRGEQVRADEGTEVGDLVAVGQELGGSGEVPEEGPVVFNIGQDRPGLGLAWLLVLAAVFAMGAVLAVAALAFYRRSSFYLPSVVPDVVLGGC